MHVHVHVIDRLQDISILQLCDCIGERILSKLGTGCSLLRSNVAFYPYLYRRLTKRNAVIISAGQPASWPNFWSKRQHLIDFTCSPDQLTMAKHEGKVNQSMLMISGRSVHSTTLIFDLMNIFFTRFSLRFLISLCLQVLLHQRWRLCGMFNNDDDMP